MNWESIFIKDYLGDRNLFMREKWLNVASYIRRLRKSTRKDEVLSLLEAELAFNNRWADKTRSKLESKKLDASAKSRFYLVLDTHAKKHRERTVFLVVYGALVAVVLKLLLPDAYVAFYLVFVAFLLAFERIFSGNVIAALEELKSIVDSTNKT
ncbi:hypothetical protein K8B33_07985 [Alcanivorax sp. JB21]|uniref:hypothetical protein n=1 Tax=Alcanivorax limicola TaxID=2874102 RepID=UPI001CC15475|nr:hypothetical protein [Alcanivorax limicola]MBZ2189033.1 hypothetical protein [Alcanivorax limicola]